MNNISLVDKERFIRGVPTEYNIHRQYYTIKINKKHLEVFIR